MKKIKYKSYILQIKLKILRFDYLLVILLQKYSRSFIKKLISKKFILIDGKLMQKPDYKLIGFHHLDVYLPYNFFNSHLYGEPLKLNIIYEDNDILIIDKQNNLVVHPSVNYKNGTLLNGLIYYYPLNYVLYRAGIVHRLDKNASGLIIVAKTQKMQFYLINLFKYHKIVREYQVIVYGKIYKKEGIINLPLGVHNKNPMRRSVRWDDKGKPAKTKFIVQETFLNFSRLLVKLYTGRTHQIRVHMAYIQHPVIGDFIYGEKINKKLFKTQLKNFFFNRLALQATKLGIFHITYKKYMEWKLNLSNDIYKLINFIKKC